MDPMVGESGLCSCMIAFSLKEGKRVSLGHTVIIVVAITTIKSHISTTTQLAGNPGNRFYAAELFL
jgi:hypothetical protein